MLFIFYFWFRSFFLLCFWICIDVVYTIYYLLAERFGRYRTCKHSHIHKLVYGARHVRFIDHNLKKLHLWWENVRQVASKAINSVEMLDYWGKLVRILSINGAFSQQTACVYNANAWNNWKCIDMCDKIHRTYYKILPWYGWTKGKVCPHGNVIERANVTEHAHMNGI